MNTKERNYGIDLLRIVSMMMVVILHINSMGGVISADYFTAGHTTALFMKSAAIGAVNIYALISGYVGYGRTWKPGSLIRLWVQAVFYSFVINLLFMLFCGTDIVPPKHLLFSFFPLTGETWWYLTSYTAVFLLMPVLNMCMERLSREMAVRAIAIVAVLSWWDLISKKNIFKLESGYSAMWLIFLYFTGAFIKKYCSSVKYKAIYMKYCGWIYLSTVCISFLLVMALQKITLNIFGTAKGDRFFIGYTTPTVMLASIALFLYFSAMEIKRTKIITFFSSAAFGVYLIHNHPLMSKYAMPQIFGRYINRSFPETLLVFLAGSILIFTLAALIDRVRIFLFTKLGIFLFCDKCSDFLVQRVRMVTHKITLWGSRFP